ncbi:MBOAT family protein, partial [Aliarcobacter butzleri]|nr:MBOAT family protein [Aliarcobacter butzleri]
SLGFRMNKILAWFITFNFINITWIFFRANDFESAMKVFGSMFSLNNIVLSEKLLTKLDFLKEIGISSGKVFINIGAQTNEILIWTFIAFILILAFKNSMAYLNSNFKANYKNLILFIICFTYSAVSMSKITEFLYFNF